MTQRVMGIEYPCDTHWYGNGYKLLQLALKAQEMQALSEKTLNSENKF
jgi:hypothetical protein